ALVTSVRVKAEKLAKPLDRSRPARPPKVLAAALGAERLGLLLRLHTGRRPPVRWGLLGNHRRLESRRCGRRNLDGKLLVTRPRAHLAGGFVEKEAGASRSFRFGTNKDRKSTRLNSSH